MEDAKLPIFQTIKASAADVCRIVVEFPLHCLATLVIATLNSVMQQGLLEQIAADGPALEVNFYALIYALPISILSAPISVVFHRFIIVGDKMSLSDVWGEKAVVIIYCVISLCILFGSYLGRILMYDSSWQLNSPYVWMYYVVGLVFGVLSFVFYIKISLVFPAIAVDRADVSVRWSLRNTKGLFWRIFVTSVLFNVMVFLPFMALERLASELGFGLASIPLLTLGGLFGMLLYPATLSEIYLWCDRKGFIGPESYICK